MRNSRKRLTLPRAETQKRLNRFKLFRDGPNLSRFDACGALTCPLPHPNQALAPPSIAVELTPINARDPGEIERGITAFARERNGGLIVTASQSALGYRNLIISLASRHFLPNVYPFRYYAANGGLASYGPDPIDPFKRASEYVDRILKGENAADLPVQAPTKYVLVINLKTAKAFGLEVPPTLLAPPTR